MAHANATPAIPRRILIVRLGAIGDVVNALTLAAALKRQFPGVHVGWLTHPLAEPLLQNNPCVDTVHRLPRKGLLGALPALRRELRAQKYDLVVDLQRLLKSAVLARLAGAPRVLGYDKARCKEGAWSFYTERIPPGPPRAHMLEQYAEFARYLGCEGPIQHVLPPWSAEVQTQVEHWLQPLESQTPWVVHIGASKPQNRWDARRYADLVEQLLQDPKAHIVLTGGPGDAADAAPTREALGAHPRFLDLLGRTDLLQLMAVFARSQLFIGCDTGPMHLASALGLPVIALFGPADPLRTGPYGPQHRIIRHPPAAPDKPLQPATMESVSIPDVLRCLSTLKGKDDVTFFDGSMLK